MLEFLRTGGFLLSRLDMNAKVSFLGIQSSDHFRLLACVMQFAASCEINICLTLLVSPRVCFGCWVSCVSELSNHLLLLFQHLFHYIEGVTSHDLQGWLGGLLVAFAF